MAADDTARRAERARGDLANQVEEIIGKVHATIAESRVLQEQTATLLRSLDSGRWPLPPRPG